MKVAAMCVPLKPMNLASIVLAHFAEVVTLKRYKAMEEEKLIFHECRAAGLVFKTVSDWTDWLKENKYDINKPVAEHYGFKYNINDVCINPHIIERKADTGSYWAVKTANTQYGWIWGYDISISSCGSCAPAGYPSRYDKSAIFYETEKNALHDALSFIIRQMENRKQQTKDTKVLAWIAKNERMNIIHPQMELFGEEV